MDKRESKPLIGQNKLWPRAGRKRASQPAAAEEENLLPRDSSSRAELRNKTREIEQFEGPALWSLSDR